MTSLKCLEAILKPRGKIQVDFLGFASEARQRTPELQQNLLHEIVAVRIARRKRPGHLEDQSVCCFSQRSNSASRLSLASAAALASIISCH